MLNVNGFWLFCQCDRLENGFEKTPFKHYVRDMDRVWRDGMCEEEREDWCNLAEILKQTKLYDYLRYCHRAVKTSTHRARVREALSEYNSALTSVYKWTCLSNLL